MPSRPPVSGTGSARPGAFARLLLYARTARHLRPVQWAYLPLRRLQALRPARPLAPDAELAATRVPALAAAVRSWPAEPGFRQRADGVLAGTFRFLNHAERLDSVDWRVRHVGHLWSYNLHYFAYGVDLAHGWRETGDPRYAERFESLASSWIAQTAGGAGDGWEPYAVSMRVPYWVYATLLFGDSLDGGFRTSMARSLAAQLAWLERRLERHIQANHLQKNYFALLVGGLVLDGPDAARWRRIGMHGLWREMGEQVLPDGGHYERSPLYHAIALGDFLEAASLLRAAGDTLPAAADARLRAMVRAHGVLSREDGALHLFNDSAEGIAPARARLDALSRATLGEGIASMDGIRQLPDTGYFGWSGGEGERILVDCGIPGPPHQPGHAHCDVLSFELDLGGRPVIVDAGVHGYDGDPFRAYVRSTRAHNTVEIAGREQSEAWGTFRLARRAQPIGGSISAEAGTVRFEGGCIPFHGTGVHHRAIERTGDAWRVEDVVGRADGVGIRSFLHLHPDFAVERQEGDRVILRAGAATVRIDAFGIDRIIIRHGAREPLQGWHCPEFGVALPSVALEMERDRNDGSPFGYTIRLLSDRE